MCCVNQLPACWPTNVIQTWLKTCVRNAINLPPARAAMWLHLVALSGGLCAVKLRWRQKFKFCYRVASAACPHSSNFSHYWGLPFVPISNLKLMPRYMTPQLCREHLGLNNED
ncbi:unnamed protein product [Leptosia nina]|uniref:Uncharacterized protein n=1 Tax=Leptosia nina TaxID=320188 RepID=A0AAV1J3D9_9NEOP